MDVNLHVYTCMMTTTSMCLYVRLHTYTHIWMTIPLAQKSDPGYLKDDRDLETLQAGVHVAAKMLDSSVRNERVCCTYTYVCVAHLSIPTHTCMHTHITQPMRALRYGPQLLPGSGFNQCQTAADTAKFAALFSGSYYHPACSCRLGQVGWLFAWIGVIDRWTDPVHIPHHDTQHPQVVDPALRVQGGVQGLRLADASVLPDLGSAGPVGSCFMLGDRCARLILEGLGDGGAGGESGKKREGGGRRRLRQ